MGNRKTISRRSLLTGSAIAAGLALVRTATGQWVNALVPEKIPLDPTKQLGAPQGKLGNRSTFEKLEKIPSDTSSRTPLHLLQGTITPSDLHFERNHGGVPAIDPNQYRLLIHGMVDKPKVFTLEDLKRLPSFSRIAFLECSGNFRTGKEELTPQQICGLTSQSEWSGVLLSTLFREVGIRPGASWFLAEGSDAAVMTRSIPMEKALKDGILALGQNGEALRPEQGYPARLFLPGWEGNTSVKWIRRIEVSDQPFMTREETSRYTEKVNGKIRQFSFDMDARSIITFPTYPVSIEKGWIEIRGIAWSGRGKVMRVDISTDAGKKWQPAMLQEPVLDKAHAYFRYFWKWDGNSTEIASRVLDETGYLQPTIGQLINARGKDMGGYHLNPITFWQVKKDGRILLRPQNWK